MLRLYVSTNNIIKKMRWFAADRDGNLAFFDCPKEGAAVPNPVIDSWRILFDYCREVTPRVKQLFLSEATARALADKCSEEELKEMQERALGSYILLLDRRKTLNLKKLLQRSNKKAFAVQLSETPQLALISDVYDYVTGTPPNVKYEDDDDYNNYDLEDDDEEESYSKPVTGYSSGYYESVDDSRESKPETDYFYFHFYNRDSITEKPFKTTLRNIKSAFKVIRYSVVKLYKYYFPPRVVNKHIAKGIKNKTIIGACKFEISRECMDMLGAFRYVFDTETDYHQYYKETPKLRKAWFAIYFGDKKLGYIPKGKNEELSKLLRYGREDLFEVKINYKDLERHPERQFGIAVKIRKMPP